MKCPKLTPRNKLELILWIVLPCLLCGIFFAVDYVDGTSGYHRYYIGWLWPSWHHEVTTPFAWAPIASVCVASIAAFWGLYVVLPYIVYHNAMRNGRNAVRWTTAFIIFTPLLAGIVYLLTWPNRKQ